MKISEMASAIMSLHPAVLESLEISQNGSYAPGTGVDGFNNVVVSVPASASAVLESLSISSNGTYTPGTGVDGFDEVIVSVAGGGSGYPVANIKSLIEYMDSEHPFTIHYSEITHVRDYCFYNAGNHNLTAIELENASYIGIYAFLSCWKLETVSLPSVTTIKSSAFYSCNLLSSIYAPNVVTIQDAAFYNCQKLNNFDFPKCTWVGKTAFYSCKALTMVSLPVCTQLSMSCFYGCTNLSSLYLLGSQICKLGNTGALNNTPMSGNGTGHIYVPASLLSDYKASTFWSEFANHIVAYSEL